MSEERFDRIDGQLARLEGDVATLKSDVAGLKTEVVDLRRHMSVLHEDVIDRIRAQAEDDSLRREMQAGFAEIRHLLQNHVVVGDAADRRFALRLDDRERRIRTLEGRQ